MLWYLPGVITIALAIGLLAIVVHVVVHRVSRWRQRKC